MSYKLTDITKKQDYSLDLPNCRITGNSTSYEVENGKIYKYSIMNGIIDKSSATVVDKIELTNYQMTFINLLSGRDGNSNRLDENDLKNVDRTLEYDLNDEYDKNGVYRSSGIEVNSKSARVRIYDQKNDTEKRLSFEITDKGEETGVLTSIKNWWNGLWSSKEEVQEAKKPADKEPEYDMTYEVEEPVIQKKAEKKSGVAKGAEIGGTVAQSLENKPSGEVKFTPNANTKIEPKKVYTVKSGDNLSMIAEKYKIPLYLIKKANSGIKKLDALSIGQKVVIPSYPKLKLETINNMNDVATATGVSESYIREILVGIEGRKSEPDLKAYYDGVKDEDHPKGYLTIGFGHTGKVRGKQITLDTKITKKEAFELLAQDILNAKMVATQYYGENFNKAPQSIQCAIIDIVFNKGVEGLEKEGSLTRNLKQDLAKHDYASAAAHVIYKTDLKGLQKRNIFRFFTAVKDLPVKDRIKAFNLTQKYYENVIKSYNDSIADKKLIAEAYSKAKTGK